MPRSLKTAWTSEEIEKLKHLAAIGASPTRIIAALKRPWNGIRSRANMLGIELPKIRDMRTRMRELASK